MSKIERMWTSKLDFFTQYNLPQLKYTYTNDPAMILYYLSVDFQETIQKYYSMSEITSSFDKERFSRMNCFNF